MDCCRRLGLRLWLYLYPPSSCLKEGLSLQDLKGFEADSSRIGLANSFSICSAAAWRDAGVVFDCVNPSPSAILSGEILSHLKFSALFQVWITASGDSATLADAFHHWQKYRNSISLIVKCPLWCPGCRTHVGSFNASAPETAGGAIFLSCPSIRPFLVNTKSQERLGRISSNSAQMTTWTQRRTIKILLVKGQSSTSL